MKLTHVTGLGRHLDLALPSNRTAVIGAVLAGVAHGLVELVAGRGFVVFGSVAAGALVFLAWAIGRETEPDDAGAATLAMLLAAPLVILGEGSAFVVAVTLIGLRMVAGTTGVALMPVDVAVVLAASAGVGLVPGGWVVVPLLAVGAGMAVVGRSAIIAWAVFGTGAVTALLGGGWQPLAGDVISAGVAFAAVLLVETTGRRQTVRSTVDVGGRLMDSRRIRLARRAAGATAVFLSLAASGVGGLVVLAPVVAGRVRPAVPVSPPRVGARR
jgi:hypothetical protein